MSLVSLTPNAHADDGDTARAEAERNAAAAAKGSAAATTPAVERPAVAGAVQGTDAPTSFIGRFTRTKGRAVLRTGTPTVEVVPGTSLVVTFPSKCVTVWNGTYAEPHACGADDVAGKWYAPYASFAEGSIRLEMPAASVSQAFQLTRTLKPVQFTFYDELRETSTLLDQRSWVENPGDWLAERKIGKDGVTLIGAASELKVQAPVGSLVCVNPAYMEGLAPREPNGVSTNPEDPRYAMLQESHWSRSMQDDEVRRGVAAGYPVFPAREYLFGDTAVPIVVGTVAAGATSYAGWMIASRGDESMRFQTTVLWGTFVALPVGIVGWWKTHAAYRRAGIRKADTAVSKWVTDVYEPDGLDVPAMGGPMTCSSVVPGAPTYVKLRSNVPAGMKYSPVRVWVPAYPASWVSVTKVLGWDRDALTLTISEPQLNELFGY